MAAVSENIRKLIADEASSWYLANRDDALTESDRAAFVAWLRLSPTHVAEYLGVASVAGDLPAALSHEADSPEALIAAARAASDVVSINAAARISRLRAPAARRWLVAAGCAAALAASLTWLMRLNGAEPAQVYATGHAEQRSFTLRDGSILRLNADSAVQAVYSSRERRLTLERGQAFFEVVHEARRDFEVIAGAARIRAVGTAFDVSRYDGASTVTVVDGQVVVSSGDGPYSRLSKGYQLRVEGGVLLQPRPADLAQSEAWLQRRIVFDNRPLGEVADEFNRFPGKRLIVTDPALRGLLVSGAFDGSDVESFAMFLGTLNDVVVEREPHAIRISRK